MSEDLNKKIQQIADMLGQDNVPDNIKGLISLLANSAPRQDQAPKHQEEAPSGREEKAGRNELEENLEMFRKIKKVMDRVGSNSDPRINLLTAIRPFLSNSRQRKIASCIKFIHMSSMARLMDDQDKGIL